jgi:hypothetical protein
MKTKLIIITLLFLGSLLHVGAHNCSFYYPQKEGAELSYTNYDKKERITGKSTQKLTKLSSSSNSISAEVMVSAYDKKDKLITESTMSVKCQDGVFSASMERFLASESMAAYQNMDVEIEGEELMIPNGVNVGDDLPDGKVEMLVRNNSIPIMDMAVTVSNRKVEAKEKVTTPAGTFDCLKISYDITTVMVITIKIKAVEWISENVGIVKSESYNKNGTLMGFTVLTELKK